LDGAKLSPEEFTLRTAPKALFIVGHDSEGEALNYMTFAGTLFGVYQLLEDALKVRWLWPGELGTVVPRTKSLTIADLNKTIAPDLVQRNLRSSMSNRNAGVEGGFSPTAEAVARRDEAVFLRRHRGGKSLRLRYGHAFTSWWERYGKDHPDWFQMVDGKRPEGPAHGDRLSMCVSNPGFHKQIIDNWLAERAAKPGETITINGCENDVYGLCSCPTCLSWDVERPEKPISERYEQKCVSDRYARFWLTLQQMAAKHDPNAVVTGYAYVNYALPPLKTKLNDHVYIGMVPDVFFPRTAEEHKWVRDMWAGWSQTGANLFLRPNYTLDGYCMPYIYLHQYADEFAYNAKHGMKATDYDSLTAMWATQGPQTYLFARWQNKVNAPLEEILNEYYSGFGPAAKQVRAYFDFWEKYTMDNLQLFRDAAKKNGGNWGNFPRMTQDMYTPEAFALGHKLLVAAQVAAARDPEALARVAFLQKGLTHAEKCVAVASARAKGQFREVYRAIADLRAYRQSIETENVANMNYCAWLEFRAWGQGRVLTYNGEPLRATSDQVAAADLKPITLRGGHGFVALLGPGENFRANLACTKIGKNEGLCRWSLQAANGDHVAEGTIDAGKDAKLDLPVPAPGIYNLIVDPGSNLAPVTLLNNHAAMIGPKITFISQTAPLYVFVPAGVKSFKVTLQSPAPAETARLTILDPEGKEVASAATTEKEQCPLEVTVPAGQDNKPWCLQISKAATGVMEDYTLTLSENIPPYWSQAPDRLLTPK
ncbi:MAG: DUF4838 domain-containing protein, partial [Armatimonadia bacterium]